MPSLDFVYDLADKLTEEKMDYFIIVVQRGDDIFHANIFNNLQKNDRVGRKVMIATLREAKKQLSNEHNDS